jgi:hypothetical protein
VVMEYCSYGNLEQFVLNGSFDSSTGNFKNKILS